jgi:predicted DNA-binding transcriptional regulator YafY
MIEETLGRINRLMFLLNELDKGNIRLSSAAQDLKVTLRTIQRDLNVLDSAGFPITPIEKGVYSFIEGFSLQKMRLSQNEAAILALCSDIVSPLGNKFASAYKNLCAKILKQNAENPFYIKVQQGQSYIVNDITQIIEKAVNDCEKIHILYEGSQANPRPVSPLKIILFDGFWYLLAFGDKGALLKLRLDKLKWVKPTGKYFKTSPKIIKILEDSVNTWFENKRNIKVKLLISSYGAKYFKIKKYFPRQKTIKTFKDGSMLIECLVCKYEEIIPTILSWIPHIAVKTQKELKNIIRQKIGEYLEKK